MKFFKKYYKSIIWAIIILIISLIRIKTEKHINTINLPLDKIAHFLMYFVLTILVLWDSNFKKTKNKKSKVIKTLLLINFYGIFIELLQSNLTTYRGGDFFDFLANLSGSIIASITFNILFFYKIYSKILKLHLLRKNHL